MHNRRQFIKRALFASAAVALMTAGLKFDPPRPELSVQDYKGDFKWLNPEDVQGETGYYFARFEAFAKPLKEDIAILHRRVA